MAGGIGLAKPGFNVTLARWVHMEQIRTSAPGRVWAAGLRVAAAQQEIQLLFSVPLCCIIISDLFFLRLWLLMVIFLFSSFQQHQWEKRICQPDVTQASKRLCLFFHLQSGSG